MYQATLETDKLIVKSLDTHADSDTRMYKSYFSNSKLMYVIYFITSCLLIFTTFSVMFNYHGNKSELTYQGSSELMFQGILANCTAVKRAYDFALFKGNVKSGVITIHGLWPQSSDGICQSCGKDNANIPSKKIVL
jgi:hypothetical protein